MLISEKPFGSAYTWRFSIGFVPTTALKGEENETFHVRRRRAGCQYDFGRFGFRRNRGYVDFQLRRGSRFGRRVHRQRRRRLWWPRNCLERVGRLCEQWLAFKHDPDRFGVHGWWPHRHSVRWQRRGRCPRRLDGRRRRERLGSQVVS